MVRRFRIFISRGAAHWKCRFVPGRFPQGLSTRTGGDNWRAYPRFYQVGNYSPLAREKVYCHELLYVQWRARRRLVRLSLGRTRLVPLGGRTAIAEAMKGVWLA